MLLTNQNEFISLFLSFLITSTKSTCRISVSNQRDRAPLFVPADARLPSFSEVFKRSLTDEHLVYPLLDINAEPFFVIPHGEHVLAVCPGKRNAVSGELTREAKVECHQDTLSIHGKTVPPTGITCDRRPRGSLLYSKRLCGFNERGNLHAIGFRVEGRGFVPLMISCFNKNSQAVIYVRHVLRGSLLESRRSSTGRPSFKSGSLFTKRVSSYYKKRSQLLQFRYSHGELDPLPGSRNHFFARGHLAPDGDFILPVEQDTTYFYINVVPQYQIFNNGNWKELEEMVRDLATSRKTDMMVITGTHEVMKMNDVNGNEVEAYLDAEDKLFPVPNYMWKLIHDTTYNQAVVLLGLNSFTASSALSKVSIDVCKDLCHLLPWVNWNRTDTHRGFVTCCSWEDLSLVIPDIPPYEGASLLS